MSHSISTLLRRNLDVFGDNDPARRRAVIDEIFIEVACSMTPTTASTAAVTRSIGSRARSRQLTLTSSTSQSPSPMCRAMAGESNGYRPVQVRLHLTLELTSSLPGKAA